jgi:hypothetical protein
VEIVLERFVALNDDRALGVLLDRCSEIGHDCGGLSGYSDRRLLIIVFEWGQYPEWGQLNKGRDNGYCLYSVVGG